MQYDFDIPFIKGIVEVLQVLQQLATECLHTKQREMD